MGHEAHIKHALSGVPDTKGVPDSRDVTGPVSQEWQQLLGILRTRRGPQERATCPGLRWEGEWFPKHGW